MAPLLCPQPGHESARPGLGWRLEEPEAGPSAARHSGDEGGQGIRSGRQWAVLTVPGSPTQVDTLTTPSGPERPDSSEPHGETEAQRGI